MISSLQHFFYMGGYAAYIWSAYVAVFSVLFLQWFLPWRHWHHQRASLRRLNVLTQQQSCIDDT